MQVSGPTPGSGWFEEDTKDSGIILFQGAIDSYDPDHDPGFIERPGKATFRDGDSVIEADDIAMHQEIFDRLPLSQSDRSKFFTWLVTDYQQAQKEERDAKKRRRADD